MEEAFLVKKTMESLSSRMSEIEKLLVEAKERAKRTDA